MEVKVNFSIRRGTQAVASKFNEAKLFYENNKAYIDKNIHDFIFVNVGPELIVGNVIRVPVINLNKRLLALYFRFCGYSNNSIDVTLISVIYPQGYPPLSESDIPHGIERTPRSDLR